MLLSGAKALPRVRRNFNVFPLMAARRWRLVRAYALEDTPSCWLFGVDQLYSAVPAAGLAGSGCTSVIVQKLCVPGVRLVVRPVSVTPRTRPAWHALAEFRSLTRRSHWVCEPGGPVSGAAIGICPQWC